MTFADGNFATICCHIVLLVTIAHQYLTPHTNTYNRTYAHVANIS
jgi:hypothetical protein